MTKSGGFLIFTCAITGRIEHGTDRTTPTSSPGTQSVGWDYYYNIEEKTLLKKLIYQKYLMISFFSLIMILKTYIL